MYYLFVTDSVFIKTISVIILKLFKKPDYSSETIH